MSTVYRYIREGIDLLAALAPTLEEAMAVARGKAYAIIDGSLLHIDRVAMASGNDRPYYSGKHKRHGVNVQVISDPVGRLIWVSPPLPGARHDLGAARDHGVLDAMQTAQVQALGDTGWLIDAIDFEITACSSGAKRQGCARMACARGQGLDFRSAACHISSEQGELGALRIGQV